MKNRPLCRIIALGTAFALWRASSHAQQNADLNPKIIMRTLILLEQQLRGAPDADAKKKIAYSILGAGNPLLAGPMRQSLAISIAQTLKSGGALPDEQKDFFGFWMLRAIAAIEADDETEGGDAARVLRRLGAASSEKPAVVDVMGALNYKGWLDTSSDKEVDYELYSADEIKTDDDRLKIQLITSMIEMDPEKATTEYGSRGYAYLRLDEPDRALQDFTKAINLAPNPTEGFYPYGLRYEGRAKAFFGTGDYASAVRDFSDAIKMLNKAKPNIGQGSYLPCLCRYRCGLGRAFACKGDYRKAVLEYNSCLSMEKSEINLGCVEGYLAWLRATCPDPKFRNGAEAVSLANKALKDPGASDGGGSCLDILAAAYAESERFEDAVKTETLAIERLAKSTQEDSIYSREWKKNAAPFRSRLELYKNLQPYREEKPDKIYFFDLNIWGH